MLDVLVSENNIHIYDSYLISSRKEMKEQISDIKSWYPSHPIFDIPEYILIAEWCSHNLLYNLGLFQYRTKDVDLNYNKSWIEKIVYVLVSLFYWK